MTWTPERIEALRRLHALGLTHAEIALKLGLTRHMVRGKVRRLGLPLRKPVIIKHTPTPPPALLPLPATPPLLAADQSYMQALGDSLTPRSCRFPHGDLRDQTLRWCGAPVTLVGASYCREHHALCYSTELPGWLRYRDNAKRRRAEAAVRAG